MNSLSTITKRTTPLTEPHLDNTRSFRRVTKYNLGHSPIPRYVWVGDRVYTGWFATKQGLRQGCVLALLLFKIFFAAVINVTYTCFKADKDIMDALAHLRKNTGAGKRGKSTAGETALAALLWGVMYAENAGVIS